MVRDLEFSRVRSYLYNSMSQLYNCQLGSDSEEPKARPSRFAFGFTRLTLFTIINLILNHIQGGRDASCATRGWSVFVILDTVCFSLVH